MLIKPRKTPIFFLQYEALLKRLRADKKLYEKIEKDFNNHQSGYAGESKVDFYLELFKVAPFRILNQVRLLLNGSSFEIDTLLVFENMIVILEIKNYKGELLFDQDLSQVTQIADGKTRALPCPFFQTTRQKIMLREWLTSNGYKKIPIYSQILLANDAARIVNQEKLNGISKLSGLYNTLLRFYNSNKLDSYSSKQVDSLCLNLVNSSVDKKIDILGKYDLKMDKIKPGIICTSCQSYKVTRGRGNWKCLSCLHTDPLMHVHALKDYSLLIGDTITRADANIWLNLRNKNTCLSILKFHSTLINNKSKRPNYRLQSFL